MFLFVNDSSRLRPKRLADCASAFGEAAIVRSGAAALIWTNDGFTECERHADHVRVLLRRPDLDHDPLVSFEWDFASEAISSHRRWSGELQAWYRSHPALEIASHLKLAACLLRDCGFCWRRLEPGYRLSASLRRQAAPGQLTVDELESLDCEFGRTYEDLTRQVREKVLESVRAHDGDARLLFSGGLDSSILALCALRCGKHPTAYTFALPKRVRAPQADCDLTAARRAADALAIRLVEIQVEPDGVLADTPLGIYLGETSRGTIVDDTPLLVSAARALRSAGVRTVWMGEAADDLFGGFKFALRYYRGKELSEYYRRQLRFDLPNELAIIQNVFCPWGVSVAQPFWTRELLRIGYSLPLNLRVDRRRKMKQVLRDAFADDLPPWIAQRPKVATRDGTGAREILASYYGTAPRRYQSLFRRVFGGRSQWHKELPRIRKR